MLIAFVIWNSLKVSGEEWHDVLNKWHPELLLTLAYMEMNYRGDCNEKFSESITNSKAYKRVNIFGSGNMKVVILKVFFQYLKLTDSGWALEIRWLS